MAAAASAPVPVSALVPSTDDNYAKALAVIQHWEEYGDRTQMLEFRFALDRLPPLPPNLEQLQLHNTRITKDMVFPENLLVLSLHYCTLESPNWPPALSDLIINRCNRGGALTFSVLPESLSMLTIIKAPSITFAAPLPSRLDCLVIDRCPLSKLPPLPKSLGFLEVVYCGLKTLPRTLPSGLEEVNLIGNQLRRLPVFPPMLQRLDVEGNPLLVPQHPVWTPKSETGNGLALYLQDLYRVQENPAEIPLWNDAALNAAEVADPFGEECWD
jgi:hypothetical protein